MALGPGKNWGCCTSTSLKQHLLPLIFVCHCHRLGRRCTNSQEQKHPPPKLAAGLCLDCGFSAMRTKRALWGCRPWHSSGYGLGSALSHSPDLGENSPAWWVYHYHLVVHYLPGH